MFVLFGLVFTQPPGSQAETNIWKWTDENGTVHLTDSSSRIPEEFQDQVEKSTVKSAPSAPKSTQKKSSVGPPSKPSKQKAKEIPDDEKVDPKTIEVLEKLVVQINGEIPRDQEFLKWHANKIAYFKLLSSLKGGLAVKKKLLEDLQAVQHPEIKKEMEWVSQNMAFESGLLSTKLAGHYSAKTSHRFRAAVKEIQAALPGKNKVVEDMGGKIKWLKATYAEQKAL